MNTFNKKPIGHSGIENHTGRIVTLMTDKLRTDLPPVSDPIRIKSPSYIHSTLDLGQFEIPLTVVKDVLEVTGLPIADEELPLLVIVPRGVAELLTARGLDEDCNLIVTSPGHVVRGLDGRISGAKSLQMHSNWHLEE